MAIYVSMLLLLVPLISNCESSYVKKNYRVDRVDEDTKPEVFEGDMIGLNPDTIEQQVKNANAEKNIFDPNGGGAPTNKLFTFWPGGKIYYTLSPTFNQREVKLIMETMEDYHNLTCIRFIARTNERDYVRIKRGLGCYSDLGRKGGLQEMSLGEGCFQKGIIVHELMHVLGFVHEQSRYDRDDYVDVRLENVRHGDEKNFLKYELDVMRDMHTPYDYGSVMHYTMYDFSSNGEPTVVPKPNPNVKIGQRNGFSEIDVKEIRLLYQCTGGTPLKIDLIQRGVRLWNHFTQYHVGNVFECVQQCKGLSECFACNHDSNNTLTVGNCFLFSHDYTVTYDNTFVWSTWNGEELEMGVRLYDPYTKVYAKSSIECKQVCQQDHKCIAMTFDSSTPYSLNKNCFLYEPGYKVQSDATLKWSMWKKP